MGHTIDHPHTVEVVSGLPGVHGRRLSRSRTTSGHWLSAPICWHWHESRWHNGPYKLDTSG